jgi:hypothetical protein
MEAPVLKSHPPLKTWRVNLGGNLWVGCFVWHRIADSPYSDGTEAAYFQAMEYPRKIGEIHVDRRHHDVASASHEAFHCVESLRKRVKWSEERLAQVLERITVSIVEQTRR